MPFGTRTLVLRSLLHYRRGNAAVVVGVAAAVAVLAGALLVGRSVRESLRTLALQRIGSTQEAVVASRPFDASLAERLAAPERSTVAVLSVRGVATEPSSGRRASPVDVWGVDERFWAFHGHDAATLDTREALLSPALAEELQAAPGATVLLRAESNEGISGSTLFGRRDDPGRALRLEVAGIREPRRLGEFSLRPRQDEGRAVFVPIATLQRAFAGEGRANLVLSRGGAAGALERDLAASLRLEDLGLKLREVVPSRAWSLESADALLSDEVVAAAREVAASRRLSARASLVYLANELRVGTATLPYSIVAAADEALWREVECAGGCPEQSAGAAGRSSGAGARSGGDISGPAAADDATTGARSAASLAPAMLNEWTARELHARVGDRLELDYYVWLEEGRLETRQAAFRVSRVVPIADAAADRGLVPEYPGITQETRLADWDPPFPVDLSRVKPRDEAYWQEHRTTPKVWLPLEAAAPLFGHRLGRTTSLRLQRASDAAGLANLAELPSSPGTGTAGASAAAGPSRPDHADVVGATAAGDAPADREARNRATAGGGAPALASALVARLAPVARGLVVEQVRERALLAARGATDFGQYFVYFSFFLVVAALLLAGLFFRFGVEQRLGELGLLQAIGFDERRVLRLFLAEAAVLGGAGAVVGMAGAVIYAGAMMLGLRTVWVGATGTRALALAVGPQELVLGAVGALAAAGVAVWGTLRGLRGRSVRGLLSRAPSEWRARSGGRRRAIGWALSLAALALVASAAFGGADTTVGFFGAGALLLAASLLLVSARLSGERLRAESAAAASLIALGFRQAAFRPGRSVLAIALVAFASFVIVSVGAFRHQGGPDLRRDGEAGGYLLLGRSVLPVHHDPETEAGRAALGLDGVPELEGVRIARFRMNPGEDASCLNLYRPERPTVIAPRPDFLREARFAFQSSLAQTDAEKANPWLLLERPAEDGAIPVIADASALQYVLHRKVGDRFALGDTGQDVRVVGALRPGLLQSELVTGEAHFQDAFPRAEGYRYFLLEAPAGRESAVAAALESRLSDFGFDAETAAARLAAFHRVENTYIATFQTLGALGLLLGTVGIGAVLVRNAFERRRELALLRAVGYRDGHVRLLVLAESALLLMLGLAIGTGAALVATLPALAERATLPSLLPVLGLVAAVALAGLLVSRLAAGVVLRLPLLESLRSE